MQLRSLAQSLTELLNVVHVSVSESMLLRENNLICNQMVEPSHSEERNDKLTM
jgi:hypothetical protein